MGTRGVVKGCGRPGSPGRGVNVWGKGPAKDGGKERLGLKGLKDEDFDYICIAMPMDRRLLEDTAELCADMMA